MKKFVFLYPITEYIDFEIDRGMRAFHYEDSYNEFLCRIEEVETEEEKEAIRKEAIQEIKKEYGERYGTGLNSCIDLRYRRNDFQIYYAVFDGSLVSDVIELQQQDRTIEVGLSFKTNTTKQPNDEYLYPDQDYILDQIGDVSVLRIGGFHMWDCVEKLARRAHERGLDVLVDEDLTEFFPGRLQDSDFKVDKYPTYNPRKNGNDWFFQTFMVARKDKPWLWQEY